MPGRGPDVGALIRAWSRGEFVARVPRIVRSVWTGRATVWVDRSARNVPFWSDQLDVCRRLRKACGQTGFERRLLDGRAQAQAMARRGDLLAGFRGAPGMTVLALSDSGIYGGPVEYAVWLSTARRLERAGVRAVALVPSPPGRWKRWGPYVTKAWSAMSWERGRSQSVAGVRGNERFWEERAGRLLRLASPAALVQPGLLRELRQLLPAWQADAATEADVWGHADVRAADATGLVLHAEAAGRWRREFAADVDGAIKARVSEAIRRWHAELPRELLRGETLVWYSLMRDERTEPPGNLYDALGFVRRLELTVRDEEDPALAAAARHYARTLLRAMPAEAYQLVPGLKAVRAASFQGVGGVAMPPGSDPNWLEDQADGPSPVRRMPVDVLIITAIPDEHQAVLDASGGASAWTKDEGPMGLPVVFRNIDAEGGGSLTIALVKAPDTGGPSAVIASVAALNEYDVRCLAMCGVCAGLRGNVALGDVIIADRVLAVRRQQAQARAGHRDVPDPSAGLEAGRGARPA